MTQVAPTKITSKHQALEAAEADYRSSGMSILAVAKKHNIPNTTLRRTAKACGWIKGVPQTKAQMVRAGLNGRSSVSDSVKRTVDQINDAEASQDVADMNCALAVARRCLGRLLAMVDMVDDPRDLKVIIEANQVAVTTIRKIRSLDAEDVPQEASLSIDVSDGFAELRAAFLARLGKTKPISIDTDDVDPSTWTEIQG